MHICILFQSTSHSVRSNNTSKSKSVKRNPAKNPRMTAMAVTNYKRKTAAAQMRQHQASMSMSTNFNQESAHSVLNQGCFSSLQPTTTSSSAEANPDGTQRWSCDANNGVTTKCVPSSYSRYWEASFLYQSKQNFIFQNHTAKSLTFAFWWQICMVKYNR